MKYLIILLSFIFFAACQEQDKKAVSTVDAGTAANDTASFTTIEWLDSVQNIGTLTFGQNPTINFRFKNTGTKPLFIISAQPGCGCTVADYPKEAIMPGKEGIIKAGYDTKNQSLGAFYKSIAVTTNTQYNVNHSLIFSGEIVKDAAGNGTERPTPVAVDDTLQP